MTHKLYRSRTDRDVYALVAQHSTHGRVLYTKHDLRYNMTWHISTSTSTFTDLYTAHDDERILKVIKLLEL